MARPNVFTTDTTLYHAIEGSRVFPAGETDPGAAWTDRVGGEAIGAATTTQALKDLIAAQDQIEAMEARLHANGHDLAVAAKATADAKAKATEMEQRALAAEKALTDAHAQSQQYMRERDQARTQLAPADPTAESEAAPAKRGRKPKAEAEPEA